LISALPVSSSKFEAGLDKASIEDFFSKNNHWLVVRHFDLFNWDFELGLEKLLQVVLSYIVWEFVQDEAPLMVITIEEL
jgi:hypothetical protein